MKCKYCGKEYKVNTNIPAFLPDSWKEKVKYIPSCDCSEKMQKKEFKQQELKLEKQRVINKVKKYKEISIMDSKLLKSTFDIAEMGGRHMSLCKRYAEKFVELGTAPQGLFLYGSVGTGKTFASACIANYLMENGKTVLIMNLGLYLIKLQKDWAEAESDVLNYVKNCDLLIVDDLGVEKTSEWVRDKVFTLVDTRYRAEKPLIITTNLNLRGEDEKTSIEGRYGIRTADRIDEMCYSFQVTGESRRKAMLKNDFLEFIA